MTTAQAQRFGAMADSSRKGMVREKLMQMQENYIRENLVLSDAQAQVFWPLYREHLRAAGTLKMEKTKIMGEIKRSYEIMTDAELDKMIQSTFEIERKIIDENQSFTSKVKSTIPPKKIVRLKLLELEYKKMLLKKAQNKMQQFQNQE
jgi:hypothetical protein